MAVTERTFVVYMVTSTITGKRYVGITSRTVGQRWKRHCLDAKRGIGFHLHAAIRKYGEEQFVVEVLSTAQSLEEACQMECAAIARHGTFGERGYNLTIGGEGGMGAVRTREMRKAQSAATKKQWAEGRTRMVESLKAGWSAPDAKARLQSALKAASARPEVKARRSAAQTKNMANPETKAKVRLSAKNRANRPEAVAIQAERMKTYWQDPEAKARQADAMKSAWSDPETKEQWRESLRKAWVIRKARTAQGVAP